MALEVLLLLHLVGFAVYAIGSVGQRLLMGRSSAAGTAPAARDTLERLSSSVASRLELPGIFVQVLTGVGLIVMAPGFLHQHWLHAKTTVVLAMLVTAHFEMINAKRIVKARAARGDAAEAEITARKKRHAAVGAVTGALLGVVLLLVTVLRTAF